MRYVVIGVLISTAFGLCLAGSPEKGENETAFRFSYSDTDFGSSAGNDFGSSEEIDLSVSYGWFLTDRHELGLNVGYVKQDIDGGTLAPDLSIDGTRFGGFYQYHFGSGEKLTPYVGAGLASLGGDLGDAYDFSWSLEGGVKVYMFEHGGFVVGLSYGEFRADGAGLPDADGFSLGAGLLLKY